MRLFSTISILLSLAVLNVAVAAPVSEEQARSIAEQFMAEHHLPSTDLSLANNSQRLIASPSSPMPLYVFNAPEQGGYVIVAGDDRVPAVLGYSNSGSIDMYHTSPAQLEWMASCAEQIDCLAKDSTLTIPRHATGTAVAPLLKSQWAQGNPYNILLRYVGNRQGITGCGATAMAQIMYYYRWPLQTTSAIPAYTTTTNAINMPELPVTAFAWDDMLDTYPSDEQNSTSTSAVAVAQLMKYCAQAVKMDFMYNRSNSYLEDIFGAFVNYFGYDINARCLGRSSYSTEDWERIIIDELTQGRPVLYRGASGHDGHFFVCDGYDGNGMFHINWGWNGKGDGFFVLNVLAPEKNGATAPSSSWGYVDRQWIITGIQPSKGGAFDLAVEAFALTTGYTTGTRTRSSGAFNITAGCAFSNPTIADINFGGGYGLFKDGQFIKTVNTFSYTDDLPPYYYLTDNYKTLKIGGVEDGNYRIMPVYTEVGTNNWRPCLGAQSNYIDIAISHNTCTVTGCGSAGQISHTYNRMSLSGNRPANRPARTAVNLNSGGAFDLVVEAFDLTTDYTTGTRANSSGAFIITVGCAFRNPTVAEINFSGGYGLFKDGQLIKTLFTGDYTGDLPPYYYLTDTDKSLTISGVKDGNYRIMPIYTEVGTNNWRPCLGAQSNYIDIVISHNTCTATVSGSSAP